MHEKMAQIKDKIGNFTYFFKGLFKKMQNLPDFILSE